MKIIIEDLVSKVKGKKEKELPEGTVIRFEIGSLQLSCQATDEGLEIYKVDNSVSIEIIASRIMIVAVAGNKIIIK